MKHILLLLIALATSGHAVAQSIDWPEVKTETKPGTRWWWLGSAVDSANLTYNLETYAKAGIGAVEITPIYGVKNNEANDIEYLSQKWMQMLDHTIAEGKRVGIQVDMNNGTGWPFGGPEVTIEEAASKAIFNTWTVETEQPTAKELRTQKRTQKAPVQEYSADITAGLNEKQLKDLNYAHLIGVWVYDEAGNASAATFDVAQNTLKGSLEKGKKYQFVALWNGHTRQAVKRAAPGGVGYVMDHLNPKAVNNYFTRFTKAFQKYGTKVPHTFFNDSYEVYSADWTPALLTEFENRRGYKLQDHFPAFLDNKAPEHKALICDYRETMSDLLLEVFTSSWREWAHKQGALVRNQAHGSPANLLDVYAAVDIPECEGFGLSDFNIKGLRTDSIWRKNDSDLSMLKYASSAAHVTGKPYTSSETFTWLTEHFRTSLSQCKPDVDLMFLSGVNHCYFHGTTYSPKEAEWPGYLFYAAIEMSPINTIWKDAPAFFDYMTRCQSFLQWGQPDNDFLVYLPVYDMWNDNGGRLLMFDIHGMDKKAPKFIKAVTTIYQEGYDMDYLSDRMIDKTVCKDGRLVTEGGTAYKALIIPNAKFMQPETIQHIVELARQGATVIFVGSYPEQVPGLANYKERVSQLADATSQLPTSQFTVNGVVYPYEKGKIITASNYPAALKLCQEAKPETMKSDFGLWNIRRSNATGHHYFISGLQNKDVDAWIQLGVHAEAAVLFDPMTGKKGYTKVDNTDGVSKVRLQLASGQSCILQTYSKALPANATDNNNQPVGEWVYTKDSEADIVTLDKGWSLTFTNTQPEIGGTFKLETLQPWTELDVEAAKTCKGTATYTIDFKLSKKQLKKSGYQDWVLDLGDVRESAHVFVNGQDAGIAFAVPYRLNIGHLLKSGKNNITIEVTGLAANYVAQMDRDGKVWRKFKDANIAPLPNTVRKSDYSGWGTVPCGLNSEVRLIPVVKD